MELIVESLINLPGFVIGFLIAKFAYNGYRSVGSPTLLRLGFAFTAISLGFFLLWIHALAGALTWNTPSDQVSLLVIGLGSQSIGYFFLAFSHSIQSLTFKHMAPAIALVSLVMTPIFIIPGNSIEHIIRSISFILLVYGATQTTVSYMWSKRKGTLIIASGLSALALGEFIGWYNFIYAGSLFYYISVTIKIIGISSILIPLYIFPIGRIKVGTSI